MDSVKLRAGLHTVMSISARGNLYLQSSGLNKQLMTENPKRCAQVVSRALNLIYILSACLLRLRLESTLKCLHHKVEDMGKAPDPMLLALETSTRSDASCP